MNNVNTDDEFIPESPCTLDDSTTTGAIAVATDNVTKVERFYSVIFKQTEYHVRDNIHEDFEIQYDSWQNVTHY
ncbi:hypothetical protein DPMN_073772 [Dreissena polymorpha]|uniref:Uncharacterized protein n=1 Tax=Dreissena polymorpha TaxID=45954 RepID=A0A9D4HBL5_DREPO|nr:hypothetical protein DPMN_073772 [Dreissena polymorpha]